MNVLNFVGTSIVANTKQTNTDEIFVYNPLLFPSAEGGVNLDVARIKNEAVDANGKKVTSDMLKTNKTVPATWKPIGEPNRLTSPDVREGTPVALYQFMGDDEYYWTTFGFASDTMRLETIIYGWNGMPQIKEKSEFDLSKFYTMTISPRDGMMSLRNSNANGEATIIETTFNYMAGHFTMAGAQKSLLIFDDVNHSFTYHNAEESVLTVAKDKIYGFAKGGIMLQTDEAISLQAKQLLMDAESMLINISGSTEINCPETQHNGNFSVDGTIDSTGNIVSQSTVQGMQGVKTKTIDTDKHRHGNGNDGDDTDIAKM